MMRCWPISVAAMSATLGVGGAIGLPLSAWIVQTGDWHALFDLAGIPQGDFNGRLLAWINDYLSTSYAGLPEAMQAFAVDQGYINWSSMGTFDAAGVPPATITYIGGALQTGDQTTYTFSAQAIGDAADDRLVLVAADQVDTSAPTAAAVTINGDAATIYATATVNFSTVVIFGKVVPTGTTANIVVTWSESAFRTRIDVAAAYGVQSATATDSVTDTGTSSVDLPIDCEAGGVVFAAVSACNTLGTPLTGCAWSNITERSDVQGENTNERYSTASDAFATQQTALAISATVTSANFMAGAALAFR